MLCNDIAVTAFVETGLVANADLHNMLFIFVFGVKIPLRLRRLAYSGTRLVKQPQSEALNLPSRPASSGRIIRPARKAEVLDVK